MCWVYIIRLVEKCITHAHHIRLESDVNITNQHSLIVIQKREHVSIRKDVSHVFVAHKVPT